MSHPAKKRSWTASILTAFRSEERTRFGGLGLTTAFLLAEVIGGVVTDSMALISDIARMFTDTVALAMALALICSDGRSTDSVRTIGYYASRSSPPRSMQ